MIESSSSPLLETIKQDYANFPHNFSYHIYSPDVYFRDPVFQFRGLERYKKMISFIAYWFANLKLELLTISQTEQVIKTEWIMSWSAPLPWRPRISVTGWSELIVDNQGLISAHTDYWKNDRWSVIKQHFVFGNKG
jgi:hypothetical protein